MNFRVIALSGWKQSGKDTAAEYLINNKKFTRVAFADVLKERVAKDYNIPLESLYKNELKEQPLLTHPVNPKDDFSLNICNFMFREFRSEHGEIPQEVFVDTDGSFLGIVKGGMPVPLYQTPRSLAIFEGSTKRTIFPNYWTDQAISQISKIKGNNDVNIVDTSIVITDLRYRNEVDQLRQAFGDKLLTVRINRFEDCASDDPSERDLDNHTFDVTIENKDTLESFIGKVSELA